MKASFRDWLDTCPTLAPAVFLCLGITFAAKSGLLAPIWTQSGLLLTLVALMAALRPGRTRRLRAAVAVVFFFLGVHLASNEQISSTAFLPPAEKVIVHATVRSTLGSGPDFRILLVESGICADTGKLLPGYGRLSLRENTLPLCAGDRIAFGSRLKKPANRGNPGEYDWETDCKNAGILWLASVRGEDTAVVLRRGGRFSPAALLFRIRESMTRFLAANSGRFLGQESRTQVRAIHKGIILGDRAEIDARLNRLFADSGLVHALSASGLHVGIVVLFTVILVKAFAHIYPRILLRMPLRKLSALACLPAMITYCLLVGSKVPAVRATIMGAVVAGAILADRRWYSFNSLALAALLILLVYPLSLFTAEFQLSFAAVAGIFLVVNVAVTRLHGTDSTEGSVPGRHSENRGSLTGRLRIIPDYLLAVALTSVAATLAVTPLLLCFFNSFPLYTIFSNLPADLVLTAALSLGLVSSVIGLAFPELGAWLLVPADICVWIAIKVAWIFASLPYSTLKIAHLGPGEFFLTSVLSLGLLCHIRNPGKLTATCVAASVAGLLALTAASHLLESDGESIKAVFLNMGKGDAAFVQIPGSRGLLIDGGEANLHFDAGQSILIPFFSWNGTRSLDSIIISHSHSDHIGGVLSVMERVAPSRIFRNPTGQQPAHLVKILDSAQERGIPILPADRTSGVAKIGIATLRFLNAAAKKSCQDDSHRDENNASAVARLDYGNISILFPGDLEKEGEEEILASGLPLAATVLKVAHHGGKNATTARFLEAVRPAIAVISAEYPPVGGSPHPDTVGRLKAAGVKVFWTGRDGAVTIEADKTSIKNVSVGKHGSAGFDETNWIVSTSY